MRIVEKVKAASYSNYKNTVNVIFAVEQKKMFCFRGLYQKYLETNDGKNQIVDLEFKDAFVLIKVIAYRNEINPYKQLSILNNLCDDFEIETYGFNIFTLTQIVSVRDCHASILISKSNRL